MIVQLLILTTALSANTQKMSIQEALDFSFKNNKELRVSTLDKAIAETNITRIKGEFRPKIDLIAGVGPTPGESGNALSSTKNTGWGASWLFKIETQMPLYAWGRKSNLLKAAKLGVEVKEEEFRDHQNRLLLEIKEAYFGYLFTLSMRDFVESSIKDISKILKKVKKKSDDFYRISILLSEIETKRAALDKNSELAKKALNLRVGTSIIPKNEWLSYAGYSLKGLTFYRSLMKKNRPEILMLQKGVKAKQLVSKANRLAKLPVIAMMANYNYAYTEGFQDQKSRFANDPYNRSELAFGVGLKWDINFGIHHAKYLKSKIEFEQLARKELYAKDGLQLELEEAWLSVRESETVYRERKRAYKMGKKWLRKVMMGATVGLVDGKRVADAYQARGMTILAYFNSIYSNYKAWAKLSKVVGTQTEHL